MPPELVSLTEGANIIVDKPILLLGRHQECDVQLHSSKVSRRHCCLAQVQDYLVVRDLGSTNGIRINGQKVQEGQLNEGDILTVGNCQFRLQWSRLPSSSHRPPRRSSAAAAEESLDFPVPLPEAKPADARDKPAAPIAAPHHDDDLADQPPSLIFPDDLQLAPSSDSWPQQN